MASGRSCPVLPTDATFDYLDEGAANIVYRIHLRYPTPEPSELEEYGDGTPPPTEVEETAYKPAANELAMFEGKLLRLRKNLPTTAPCATAQDSWLRAIAPLFHKDQVVDQCLVQLRPAGAIEVLNKQLEEWEQEGHPTKGSFPSLQGRLRPPKRHGIYLADDDYGLLVEDMSPGDGQTLIQFKPKWLIQSPAAPRASKRCRQCARVARMNAENTRKSSPLHKSFCPLDLVSSNRDDIIRCAKILLHPEPDHAAALRFALWVERTPLLRCLRERQQSLDTKGVFKSDPNDEKFRAAMTLRDCTVFLRFLEDDPYAKSAEAKLGDLDLKSKDKAQYWRVTERALIDEGWYMGTEKAEDKQPLTCQLYRA